MATALTNWAGNVSFATRMIHQPSSLDELRSIVARLPNAHVLGTRHSFNAIADAADLISLDAMPREIDIDREAHTVTVNAGMSKFSGVVQADTVISNAVVSSSYTPGAGNIW